MKKRRLIFGLKLLAILDILFSRKWELITYHKNSLEMKSRTKLDKDEILNSNL
jgi:hypothetical protein